MTLTLSDSCAVLRMYGAELVSISPIIQPYADLLTDQDVDISMGDLRSIYGPGYRSVSWDALPDMLATADEWDTPAIVLPVSYGDYGGTLIDRANHHALVVDPTDFAHLRPWLRATYGGHGSNGVVFPLAFFDTPLGVWEDDDSTVGQEIVKLIAALADYPLLDDELYSEIESELIEEGVRSDWFRHDMRRSSRSLVRGLLPTTTVPSLQDFVEDIAWRLDDADWDGFGDWFLVEYVYQEGGVCVEDAAGSLAFYHLDDSAAADIAETWVRTGHTPWAQS